jgi:2-polyprenyl-3-methyl-5-hydroxy-6-metoxy-1,4-benzoquinol methylase
MLTTITHQDALISIDPIEGGKRRVQVKPHRSDFFIPISVCETKYPLQLVEQILEIKGANYLCDELSREEDPNYVLADLEFDLRAYFDFDKLAGWRIMDFGCGSGASTMILARMFPESEIVGVELDEKLLSIARARLDFYSYPNVVLLQSPDGNELPENVGNFDLIVMSAVYEHLLPDERKTVVPKIWEKVKPGGYFFLNMTPHRYFPIEHHTTALPLINYLPDSAAYAAAKRFSKQTDPSEPWEMLLRRGIRGSTEGQIESLLNKSSRATLLEPNADGIRDRIDLWYARLSKDRMVMAKKSLRLFLKTLKTMSGIVLVPNLSLVFRKAIS